MKRLKYLHDKNIIDDVADYQYRVPAYTVMYDKGIQLVENVNATLPDDIELPQDHTYIQFVKGSKIKEENKSYCLDGVLVEQLLFVCLDHLQTVNVGDLANRDTSIAITHIEEALLRLGKRELERKSNGTLGTYKK